MGLPGSQPLRFASCGQVGGFDMHYRTEADLWGVIRSPVRVADHRTTCTHWMATKIAVVQHARREHLTRTPLPATSLRYVEGLSREPLGSPRYLAGGNVVAFSMRVLRSGVMPGIASAQVFSGSGLSLAR